MLTMTRRAIKDILVQVIFVSELYFSAKTGLCNGHRAPGVMSESGWREAAARKRSLAKATFLSPPERLPAWVISLEASRDRRRRFRTAAAPQNMTFEFVAAVDGKARDPEDGGPFDEEVSDCELRPQKLI